MIFVGTHHKTGTILFQSVFWGVSQHLGLRFYSGWQANLPPATDLWFMEHSRIDPERLDRVKGIHVIRHPLEVICSAYRWHLMCNEPWCVSTEHAMANGVRYNFDGLTYQQKLRSLSPRDGILFELRGRSYHAISDMYEWNYDDNRFMNVRLEEVSASFDDTFSRIFSFLGLDVGQCVPIAAFHDLRRFTPERLEQTAHITNKNRDLPWQRYFSDDAMLDEFRKTFPADVMARLGYDFTPN